jgi:hypothetical protein
MKSRALAGSFYCHQIVIKNVYHQPTPQDGSCRHGIAGKRATARFNNTE